LATRGHRFDDLSKTLAQTDSRRGVFKAVLAGVAGTVIHPQPGAAQILPTFEPCQPNVQAFPPCVSWCAQYFPLAGPGSVIVNGHLTVGAKCAQLAACGQGPCFECGPGAPAGAPPVCVTLSGSVCCSAGQTCVNGTCVAACLSNGNFCSEDFECCSGFCHGIICLPVP
jgi:hypothetical protein